jgi:hypothetical protein
VGAACLARLVSRENISAPFDVLHSRGSNLELCSSPVVVGWRLSASRPVQGGPTRPDNTSTSGTAVPELMILWAPFMASKCVVVSAFISCFRVLLGERSAEPFLSNKAPPRGTGRGRCGDRDRRLATGRVPFFRLGRGRRRAWPVNYRLATFVDAPTVVQDSDNSALLRVGSLACQIRDDRAQCPLLLIGQCCRPDIVRFVATVGATEVLASGSPLSGGRRLLHPARRPLPADARPAAE